jgi:S-adenosylmethionine:tRNA ribosyltransferase-isomerase
VKLSDFDYDLPEEFIAQHPVEPRDAARLMVMDRASGALTHARFRDLGRFLQAGDVLVFNDTRVIPARLPARKADTGGKAEVLLLRRVAEQTWEALVGGKGLHAGARLRLEAAPEVEAVVLEALDGARRLVRFSQPITPRLDQAGRVPLPPYIHAELRDRERYQTVYARVAGSAAAPTAGLHFTPALLDALRAQGVLTEFVTLHVGLDTFLPVQEDDPREHRIHGEWRELSAETAARINAARAAGGRVIAVGTTSVRTLESAAVGRAAPDGAGLAVGPVAGPTGLYILPGHQFRAVDAMITNFHLPRSTLLMLVAAFAGREQVLAAYDAAKRAGYRFYSFGDAQLIL